MATNNIINYPGPATNGQIIVGSTGAAPALATITAGTGISVTNGAASITITSTLPALAWTEVTGTSQSMAVNSGYIANNAGLVTLTLPSSAAVGSQITITGKGAGGWFLAQNTNGQVNFGSLSTTVGGGGSISSTLQFDTVSIVCITANNIWNVISSVGNLTVV